MPEHLPILCRRFSRAFLAVMLAVSLAGTPAHGLVTLNEGRDRVHITGTVGVTGDSNVFQSNTSESDVLISSSVTADYARKAGWIGVNARLGFNLGDFTTLDSQDFHDPSISVELTEQTGRTTGALTLSAARESRADAAVNTRSTSWNYNYALNYRYSLSRNYDLSGGFGYSRRDYVSNPLYANQATYSASIDILHVLTTDRDIIGGYRYRYVPTSRDTATTDHGVDIGINGRLIRGVTGSLRFGYQARIPSGGTGPQSTYGSWTAAGSLAYAINQRLNLGAQISKDFSTTAIDSSVDVLASSLSAQYALSSRLGLSGSVGWSHSKFLDAADPLATPGTPGPARRDQALNAGLSATYTLNEHLKLGFSYTWFRNTSSLAFADFIRSSWTANVTSRW